MTDDDPAAVDEGEVSSDAPATQAFADVRGTAFVDRGRNDIDEDELVGPGRYGLRIQPAAALAPGTADSRRLLIVWYIRKSFYWMLFVGLIVAAIVQFAQHPGNELDLGLPAPTTDPSILATWGLVFLALALKFVNGWVALGLAVPLALAHEPNLTPRTNFGSGIGQFFDRKHLASAFRSLRWTHHVRQVALKRLGPTGERLGKLDPILDIVNIASGVLMFIVLMVLGVLAAA